MHNETSFQYMFINVDIRVYIWTQGKPHRTPRSCPSDLRVVYGPEAVEHEMLLVPGRGALHLQVGLVADDVVHEVQVPVGAGGRTLSESQFNYKQYSIDILIIYWLLVT